MGVLSKYGSKVLVAVGVLVTGEGVRGCGVELQVLIKASVNRQMTRRTGNDAVAFIFALPLRTNLSARSISVAIFI